MSWSNSLAKEFLEENEITIKVNSKPLKAAISRDPSFNNSHLIIRHHLNTHDTILIEHKKWKLIGNEGLGQFFQNYEIGYRCYILIPEIELKENDKFKLKGKTEIYTVKSINKEEFYFSIKEDDNLLFSLFYPEEFIKI